MKITIPLLALALGTCTSQAPEKEAANTVVTAQPVEKQVTFLSDASLRAIIRAHGDSISDLVDAGNSKTGIYFDKVNMENREFISVLTNELGQESDTLIWRGSPELTVKKKLYIDKTLGLIYKRETIDTVLKKFEPIFDGGDSSVVVENGVPGGAEIEDLTFNEEEEIECEAEPFGRILRKEIKPGQVLVSDYGVECRDTDGTGLVYYRHIRDKKYKNGYWVAERSGWFSQETGEGGGNWSAYHGILFLKEKAVP